MEVRRHDEKIEAVHGTIASFPGDFFGYFGWPTIATMDDGSLVAAASGLRNAHVCPFGRSVFFRSRDEGKTWSSPTVVNDSPLDDRDTGIVCVGGQKLLISWFTTDNRKSSGLSYEETLDDEYTIARWREGFARMTDENESRWMGAWIRTSEDGGESWENPVKVPVTAPHGPIRLSSGELLYFGKELLTDMEGFQGGVGSISALVSSNSGRSWFRLGEVPLVEGTLEGSYHEPHVAQLPGGKLVGLIRVENCEGSRLEDLGLVSFSLVYTESVDGGHTWSRAEPMGFHGSPPHLLAHTSGALVGVYGRRLEPFGERVMISRDDGVSWDYDYALRDDGPDGDLGYPSSVELADGSILTAYYQKPGSVTDKCAFLWSRWRLPE